MNKGGLVVVLGLLLGTAAFAGVYYLGTASSRSLMREPQPELAWLKKEFNLGDAEFARVTQLHEAYLPRCAERCRRIAEQNQKLHQLLGQATDMTPEIRALLLERAQTRAECEAEMLQHFLAVSRTMPAEQGRRYLAWVEQQAFLNSQGMERRHQTGQKSPSGHEHHH